MATLLGPLWLGQLLRLLIVPTQRNRLEEDANARYSVTRSYGREEEKNNVTGCQRVATPR